MESENSSDQRRVIQASEILAKIERGEGVYYDDVIVEGDLDISGLDLPMEHVDRTKYEKKLKLSDELKVIRPPITITNSEIRGRIDFCNSLSKEPINFRGDEFGGDAYFGGAEFEVDANFEKAQFAKNASFMNAKFGRYAYFKDTKFSWCADFMETKFVEYTYFWGTKFDGHADFERAQFGKSANFWGAEFGLDASFKEADMGEHANFMSGEFGAYANFDRAKFGGNGNFGAKFGGDTNFHGVEFGGNADVSHAQFKGYISFKDAKFSDPKSQEIACRIAKRKMEEVGNKEDADDYFYREMEAIRIQKGIRGTKTLTWPWKMQVSEWLKLVGSKIWRLGYYDIFEYILFQCIFGYGVSPLRVLSYWIAIAFAFASIYWYYDAVEGARTWVDYIWFSIATSATPGYALYNPIGNYKIVTGIQAIIGTFMWAAFVATFARKWQR